MATPSSHRDPSHRRATYHTPVGHSASEAQQRRREAALTAQNTNRQHAFLAARSVATSGSGIDMDDLSLTIDSSDDDDDDAFADAPIPPTSPIASTSTLPSDHPHHHPHHLHQPNRARQRKAAHRPKHKAWAANLLSHAETLNLAAGLPGGLETEWSAVVVPKGKRCLCVTGVGNYGSNTTLLSRVKGRALARRMTSLPPDCLLDCVYDKAKGVLWVLDLVKWSGHFFFLASKLSELAPQPYLPPSSASPLLVLPAPHVPAPLSIPTLRGFLPSLATPLLHRASLLAPGPPPTATTVEVPLESTGLLLYLNSGHYDSGLTALVGWVPNEADEGEDGREGMARLWELVREGSEREVPVAMEG